MDASEKSRRNGGSEAEQPSQELSERLRVTEYFWARFAEEVRRAERYGRFLTVVFVHCDNVGARHVFNSMRPLMRSTDIVEVVCSRRPADAAAGAHDAGRDHVVMILPETGRNGGRMIVDRLRTHLADLGAPGIGIAHYPDDSTQPNTLFSIARERAEACAQP
ncbi:MAG: hypothetical protein GXY85_07995 [Candidatus Brocadiaceae bacterium]|nr:hypothetical protein [Candidatus Brocadiaceae bacterium]